MVWMRDAVGPHSGSDCGDAVVREQLDLRHTSKEETVVLLTQVSAYYPNRSGQACCKCNQRGRSLHLLSFK